MGIDTKGRGAKPRGRTGLVALAWTAALGLVPLATLGAQGESQTLEDVRASLDRWVEMRRVISKERGDWKVGRELLQDRVGVLEGEIASVRERIAQTRESIASAEEERSKRSAEKEGLKAAASGLEGRVRTLEERTRALLGRLPQPLRDHVAPLSQRLPAAAAETKLSLSERFQNVVGILNELDKFHREVRVTSEVRTLADGSSAEVTALYLGVAHGYYVTADGLHAGLGRSGAEGWEWTPVDGSAAEIAAAVAILENEGVARFVRVPVQVQ